MIASMPAKRRRSATITHVVIDGTCAIDLHVEDAPHLEGHRLRCELVIAAHAGSVDLVKLEPITTRPFKAQVGPVRLDNQTTVRLRSSETGQLSRDGHASIPVVLHFDHSADVPFFEEDSDLALTLATAVAGGSPLDRKGRVVLVGEGDFSGGVLDGKRCRLTYKAVVAPLPW
jgi:hypothetical protein